MKGILAKTLSPSFAICALALSVALGGGGAVAVVTAPTTTPITCVNVTAFQNGWKNASSAFGYGRARFCKDSLGYIHLYGLLTAGAKPATAFRLPLGFRPKFNHAFVVVAGIGGPSVMTLSVWSNGDVVPHAIGSEAALDGVTFHIGG